MRIDIGHYTIRDWSPDDSVSLAKYANNPRVAANLRDGFPSPYTQSDAEAFLSNVASQSPRTVFAIASDEEAIGSIGLMIGRDVHRFTAELGYWLAEPFWGKGIMTSAVVAITDYGFAQFNLNRIYAEPFTPNLASARLLEKAGYSLEGTLRASVVKDGQVLDQFMYAKINKQFT
jgi:ribosomal-protein-alanine N-acetyltransferase